ncbi:hypothetical protein VTK73DRAFT_6883 [Phialemonium thermophilum]|uniref:Uncharacterized protein n=1 Tax=Phialemonium thermophilum TaxID=223376 RepID=A0ABR3WHL4_9PEZI
METARWSESGERSRGLVGVHTYALATRLRSESGTRGRTRMRRLECFEISGMVAHEVDRRVQRSRRSSAAAGHSVQRAGSPLPDSAGCVSKGKVEESVRVGKRVSPGGVEEPVRVGKLPVFIAGLGWTRVRGRVHVPDRGDLRGFSRPDYSCSTQDRAANCSTLAFTPQIR